MRTVSRQVPADTGALRLHRKPKGEQAVSTTVKTHMPKLFRQLIGLGCLAGDEICRTADGFCAAVRPLSDIMAACGMVTFPDDDGTLLECGLFFDDWYLYALPDGDACTYSLFKMREQEYDAKEGRVADSDTPGVTVSFVALQQELLPRCLADPQLHNCRLLTEEIGRVVSARGQSHSPRLKDYFRRTEAQGPYLIADLYTRRIASLAVQGRLPVPECFAALAQGKGRGGRIVRFLEENNWNAGAVVCDRENLFFENADRPTRQERLAVLATHTGNTSFASFAAEVQFHAKFLAWWAKIPIPFLGRSLYDSALRADMSIADAALPVPLPYYCPNSPMVKRQAACHGVENRLG